MATPKNVRVIPIGGAATAWAGSPGPEAAGRRYYTSTGTPLDVPASDAAAIKANFASLGPVDTTANRPLPQDGIGPGYSYVDSTLGKMIWWDGSAWRDATGASV